MGIVHERQGWWIEPDGHTESGGATAAPSAAPDHAERAMASVRIRPLGRWSAFTTRPVTYTCLNCGEWIHPGTDAWYDPDLDESVCSRCWPESLTAAVHR